MDQPSNAGDMPNEPKTVLVYDGRLSELFGICLVNLLLTILTVGVFRFWAITRVRRYVWSHMRFQDTRFTYTGKGKELLEGFLLVILILVLLFAAADIASIVVKKSSPALAPLPFVPACVGMLALFGATRFSAQRYRLSRTEWRGISGGMDGSALRYGANSLIYLLACIVTLFQVLPWMQVGLARWRINASHFGSTEFRCDGRGRNLWIAWLVTLVFHVVLLGAVFAAVVAFDGISFSRVLAGKFKGTGPHTVIPHVAPVIAGVVGFMVGSAVLATGYYASLLRLIVGSTAAIVRGSFRIETLRFSTTITATGLSWLVISNLLIIVLTLGLGVPVALHRHAGHIARTTFMTGTFDVDTLLQSTLARPTLGEGFMQALDPGVV